MDISVAGLDQIEKWRDALALLPENDIYFTPEFHHAYELNGNGKAVAFIAKEGDRLLFHPFFLRPIDNDVARRSGGSWYDIESVQGYSGPLTNTDDSDFLSRAWARLHSWCAKTGVVAEFVRFNHLLENHRLHEGIYRLRDDRQIVVVPLPGTTEELWSSYPRGGHRTRVRFAQKSGLVCEASNSVEARNAFRRLHNLTMARNEASASLSDAFLNYLLDDFSKHATLLVVRHEGEIISSGLFLLYGSFIHYQFGNADERYLGLRPNNLLLHAAAELGVARGCTNLNLGGGRTAADDDQLLRFKRTIARTTKPYYVGSRVHHEEGFRALCSTWLSVSGQKDLPRHSFPYRVAYS
jgi:hypothetical protein